MKTATWIREKLRRDEVSLGSWQQIADPAIAEILGQAGYDWVAVDLEHGAIGLHQLPDLFRALELGGTVPLVRVGKADSRDIKAALDAGAAGIILPNIKNADQLAEMIAWATYPTRGSRGVGYCRANLYGRNFDAYIQRAAERLVIAQIEDFEAVERLDRILTVEGLDAIMVGPYDLSGSMGLVGQFEHPRFNAAMERIKNLAREHDIPIGIHVVQPEKENLQTHIRKGFRFIAYGTDGVFLYQGALAPDV